MKKDKKDKFDHTGHQHGHQDMQPDPLKTENHEEHVAFLKDRYGFNIHGSNEAEKQYEAGDGPRIPPVDALFKSGKDEKRIEESLDRSYELTKEAMGKNPEGMTRRNFLKAASMASAAAGVAMAGKGLVPAGDAEALSLGPIYLDPFIGWTPLKKQQNYSKPDLATWEPKVAVVKKNTSDTIEETVYKAIEEAGKLDEIQEGDWVLIKVNASVPITRNIIPDSDGDIDAPATTNPEVLRAVIRAVK